MKYLLLIAIVVAVLFIAKLGRGQSRKGDEKPTARRSPAGSESGADGQAEKEPLLACAQCGLLLPMGESLPGRGGVFCDEAHRNAFEQAHPL